MSDKKRRDITLGEMQDECKRVECNCELCEKTIHNACCSMQNSIHDPATPRRWNLTDPPRFNEAQMAALRKSYESGIKSMTRLSDAMVYRTNQITIELSDAGVKDALEIGETLDLAELLGKDNE